MELERNGAKIEINFGQLTDVELAVATAEVAEANALRRVDLSVPAGNVAVEGANTDVAIDEVATPETLSTPVTPESLAEQLTVAYKGYETVATLLNDGRKKKEHVEIADRETVAKEFEAWLSEEKLSYVAKAMEADPELRFTLVATPNVIASADEIIDIAKEFGKNQPHSTTVWSNIYGKYTPEQLSGTDPSNGNSTKFSLIPNKFDPALQGTVASQRAHLALVRRQEGSPFVGVPSVLEDVTFWNTLRASGDNLSTGDVYDRTHVRHFDLAEKRVGVSRRVLASFVFLDGQPGLDDSRVGDVCPARISVK